MKKGLVFDLDGTLSQSKMRVDANMARLLSRLLAGHSVAVVGGGKFKQLKLQVLGALPGRAKLENLYLFPVNGAELYIYRAGWKKIYAKKISKPEAVRIRTLVGAAINKFRPNGAKAYGPLLENRGAQFTLSFLGQRAPLAPKMKWHSAHNASRHAAAAFLRRHLPGFEVLVAGLTSIDITKRGVDKALAVREFAKHTRLKIKEVVFIGDALYRGGNDETAKKSGVDLVKIKDPRGTAKFINNFLNQRGKA